MDLIPSDVLWRQKEGFSDGVASEKKSLFEILQEIIEKEVCLFESIHTLCYYYDFNWTIGGIKRRLPIQNVAFKNAVFNG